MNNKSIATGIIILAIIGGVYWVTSSKEKASSYTSSPSFRSTTLGDKDCGDFSTHSEAQVYFMSKGGPSQDPDNLDRDKDGIACETLP